MYVGLLNHWNCRFCETRGTPFSDCSGGFELKHDLNTLPRIDRELTRWKLYAYANGNFKYTPGTYTMVACSESM